MVDPSIVREWLDKANEDLLFAEASLRDGSEFYAQICFHFQQAAEKCFKAFTISRGLPFNKIHDLVNLLKTCAEHDPTLADLKEDCIIQRLLWSGWYYKAAVHGRYRKNLCAFILVNQKDYLLVKLQG